MLGEDGCEVLQNVLDGMNGWAEQIVRRWDQGKLWIILLLLLFTVNLC